MMNRSLLSLVCALFLVCATSAQVLDEQLEWEFFSLANNERHNNNRPPLTPVSNLRNVARGWSFQLSSTNGFYHNPNLNSAIPNAAPGSYTWAECLGKGGDVGSVWATLMQSSEHRAIFLSTEYQNIGIGVYWNGNVLWVTANFASGGNQPLACCGVSGAIAGLYNSNANLRTALGGPTTNELITPDGIGRFNHFVHGSIYWTSSTGAHEVIGAIREFWKNQGWEAGSLGYPTSGEFDVQEGRRSNFQGGSLIWTRATNGVRRV